MVGVESIKKVPRKVKNMGITKQEYEQTLNKLCSVQSDYGKIYDWLIAQGVASPTIVRNHIMRGTVGTCIRTYSRELFDSLYNQDVVCYR